MVSLRTRWSIGAGVVLAVVLAAALTALSFRLPRSLNQRYGPGGVALGSPTPDEPDPAPPSPSPCPVPAPTKPKPATIYCGPPAPPGNGAGPQGVCTGVETEAPCGPGAVPGTYYALSLPERCDGLVVFDGKVWESELPPPFAGATQYVWMALEGGGAGAGFISQQGEVGFTLYSATPVLPPPPPCPAPPIP